MKKLVLVMLLGFSTLFAIEELNENNFYEKIENKKVIIDFYATWCPPCKIVSKNLKALDKNDLKDITIYKVDIDKYENLKAAYEIRSLPTIVYMQDTKVIKKQIGLKSKKELQKNIKKYFH